MMLVVSKPSLLISRLLISGLDSEWSEAFNLISAKPGDARTQTYRLVLYRLTARDRYTPETNSTKPWT